MFCIVRLSTRFITHFGMRFGPHLLEVLQSQVAVAVVQPVPYHVPGVRRAMDAQGGKRRGGALPCTFDKR